MSAAIAMDLLRFDGALERVFEPSRIRRGRLATSPTWYVTFGDGQRWRFCRKGDATAFIARGGICVGHDPGPMGCRVCMGIVVRPPYPLYVCACGHRFRSEATSFGPEGCPSCDGLDIEPVRAP